MLTPETINIIKTTVPVIHEHGATVTATFYQNLLIENPALSALFNQSNQASSRQSQALARAVLAYAQHVDNPQALSSAIKHITHKHASLFVKPEQYDVVGKYLLDAFGQVLGDVFTPEVRDAWAAAYGALADIMIAAEAELYKQAEDWNDWRDFAVHSKEIETPTVTSFTLRPHDGKSLPHYSPGQYVSARVYIPSLGYTQIRQYSLSDRYTPDTYRISVRRDLGTQLNGISYPGSVSNALHDSVQEGDIIQLSRPYGDFTLGADDKSTTPIVLISAGIGVTPMISMLNTMQLDSPERQISWIHGAHDSESRVFADHVNRISKSNSNICLTRFLTQPTEDDRCGLDFDEVGRVDLDKCDGIKCLFLQEKSTKYYICGPPAFMVKMQEQLGRRGVAKGRIQSERFGTGGF